jgi:hypothetical protein
MMGWLISFVLMDVFSNIWYVWFSPTGWLPGLFMGFFMTHRFHNRAAMMVWLVGLHGSPSALRRISILIFRIMYSRRQGISHCFHFEGWIAKGASVSPMQRERWLPSAWSPIRWEQCSRF